MVGSDGQETNAQVQQRVFSTFLLNFGTSITSASLGLPGTRRKSSIDLPVLQRSSYRIFGRHFQFF